MSAQPDFMIIGAMKCATSTLHEQLAAQPGIFMSEPKEPNFFSDEDNWARGWEWYTGLFAEGEGAQLRGESSTHYTKLPTYPDTVSRIADKLPGTRFIYVMRSPVDRLISHYIHEWSERTIRDPIDQAVEACPRLIEYSSYAMQLRPYLETFGSGRLLPVFFEALRAQPDAELGRIARFLGVPHEVSWNDDLGARNVSRDRLRRSPVRDLLVHAPGLSWLRKNLIPKAARERVKDLWRMQDRPELSAAVRETVERRLDEDLVELSSWTGRDLRCATFAEVASAGSPEWQPNVPGSA